MSVVPIAKNGIKKAAPACASPPLTITKTWQYASTNDRSAITVARGGSTIDSLDSVATASSSSSTDGTPVTVWQGEQITLVTQDDRGQPEETVRATREMLAQSKPVVLAGYFGDRNLLALADSGLLAQTQTSLVGYRSVDPRVLQVPQLFNARANTQDEMAKIATHLATVGITKLGLFYEDGPGAASVVKLVEEAIKPKEGHAPPMPWPP